MKTRIVIFIVSLFIVSGFLTLAFTIDCWNSQWENSQYLCGDIPEKKLQPIFWSFVPLLAISIILLFVRQEVFKAWAKFAVPGFIVMIALMLYAYSLPPLGGFMNWGDYDQFATLTLPPLFFILSLIIIAKKVWQIKNSPANTDDDARSTREVTGIMRILKK